RDYIQAKPKMRPASGPGMRRVFVATNERRSAHSVNREIRAVRAWLNWMRERGLVDLTSDAIADAQKQTRTAPLEITTLTPPQCRGLLLAAMRHDARNPKRYPSALFVGAMLVLGLRLGEAEGLRWDDIDLDRKDNAGTTVGGVYIDKGSNYTKRTRWVLLHVSPGLREAFRRAKRTGPFVFGGSSPMARTTSAAARKRMKKAVADPDFDWKKVRRTTGSHLTTALNGWTLIQAARQMGHSAEVAQRHYLEAFHGIRGDTIDETMGIADLMARIPVLPGDDLSDLD
ncbi:MAG: tyrosine-type recombinase/integrase, partial [Mycobacterium sp.]